MDKKERDKINREKIESGDISPDDLTEEEFCGVVESYLEEIGTLLSEMRPVKLDSDKIM